MSLPLLSPSQMAEMDRRTIEGLGVPGLVLMENAASACVEVLLRRWPLEASDRGVLVLAGPGNNGGDGLAIARRLVGLGVSAEVVLTQSESLLGRDAQTQLALARAFGVIIHEAGDLPELAAKGVLVDALFGTGLGRGIEGELASVVEAVNSSDVPVLAVDIPSGVHGDTGQVAGGAIRADVCVTFGAAKVGHFAEPGRALWGALTVADIGIPVDRLVPHVGDVLRLLDDTCLLPVRESVPHAHKGTFGHLLVVAGGPGKVGAARLTCEAALRAGVGLVTLALPVETPVDSLASLRPEVMVERVPGEAGAFGMSSLEPLRRLAVDRSALAIGPGLGTAPGTVSLVRALLRGTAIPSVVDADALNAMVGEIWPKANAARVVTPHPGEAARLLRVPTDELQRDRVKYASMVADCTGATAVLKGAGTVVSAAHGAWLNPSGNPGMATAGSGDVLTGVIGALLARGLESSVAACGGVYWHGRAGDEAASARSERGLLASDISDSLGCVLTAPTMSPAWAAWVGSLPEGWSAS